MDFKAGACVSLAGTDSRGEANLYFRLLTPTPRHQNQRIHIPRRAIQNHLKRGHTGILAISKAELIMAYAMITASASSILSTSWVTQYTTLTMTSTITSYGSITASPAHELKRREAAAEIVVDLGGHTLTASQYPTVTTGWWESVREDGVHTWVKVPFTQTFATTVLDQLGEAQKGSIGVGSDSVGNTIDRFASMSVSEKVEDGEVVAATHTEMESASGIATTTTEEKGMIETAVPGATTSGRFTQVAGAECVARFDTWLCYFLTGGLMGVMLSLAFWEHLAIHLI